MESESRIYVKNLPPDVQEKDFKRFFKKFGNVSNVDIKGNYGFFSVSKDHITLESLISNFSNKDWNGCKITVEKSSKESFLGRLAKEREAVVKLQATECSVKNKPTEDNSDSVKAGIPKFRGTASLSNGSLGKQIQIIFLVVRFVLYIKE